MNKTNEEILADLDARLKAVEGNQSPEERINNALGVIRQAVAEMFPEPMRETSLANTKLDECAMWLSAAASIKAMKEQEDGTEEDSDTEILSPVPVPAESVDAETEREV